MSDTLNQQPQKRTPPTGSDDTTPEQARKMALENRQKKEKVFVFVENTTTQPMGIGEPPPKQLEKAGVVQGVSPQEPKVKLIPGINRIEKELWERSKEQVMVQKFVEEGLIVEHVDVLKLSDFTVAQATQIIPKIFDRELLSRWIDEDARAPIQKKLKDQVVQFKKALEGGRGRNQDYSI